MSPLRESEAEGRRHELLLRLRRYDPGDAKTTDQIFAGLTQVYAKFPHGGKDVLHNDLRKLTAMGMVERLPGKPAKWKATDK